MKEIKDKMFFISFVFKSRPKKFFIAKNFSIFVTQN